ncbi:porin [Bauldia sp.]|uniref:porin n=1 Tax=Bauldia sp. TaxID=2575872 RepID=UPI003BAD98AB
MKLKSLLLGTAAAVAVTGGAQAADLALAVEPIDYVKVCDAFGTGYYYIPGTDVCLKIGGKIQLDMWFYDDDDVGNYFNFANWAEGYDPDSGDAFESLDSPEVAEDVWVKDFYRASWEFKSEAAVNFTAKSMSDLGPIVTHFAFTTKSDNNDFDGSTKTVRFDGGYGQIGPVMFGWTDSLFDPGGGYTYDGSIRSDKKVDQARLSYMMGTWGIMLGLEDPRDRYAGPKNATGDYPDIVLALTGGVAGFDVKAAAAITDRTNDTGWGVNLTAEADFGGFQLKATGAYSDNAKSFTGGSNCSTTLDTTTVPPSLSTCDDGEWWSAFISASAMLSGNLKTAATASYQDKADGKGKYGVFEGAIGLYYYPSGNSEIGAELLYKDPEGSDDSLAGHVRWKTEF